MTGCRPRWILTAEAGDCAVTHYDEAECDPLHIGHPTRSRCRCGYRKVELFVAALDRCYELVQQALATGATRAGDGDPEKILHKMGGAYAQLIVDKSLLMLQVRAQPAADIPEIAEAVRRGLRRVTEYTKARSGAEYDEVQRPVGHGPWPTVPSDYHPRVGRARRRVDRNPHRRHPPSESPRDARKEVNTMSKRTSAARTWSRCGPILQAESFAQTVGRTPCRDRTNSGTPSCCAKRRNWPLTAGWAISRASVLTLLTDEGTVTGALSVDARRYTNRRWGLSSIGRALPLQGRG